MTLGGRLLVAAGIVIHLGFLVSLKTGSLDPLFADATHRLGKASDFFVIYQAGMNLRRGESPYAMAPRDVPYGWHDYRYLPLSALAVSLPLTLLPPWSAWLAWIVVNELALIACLLAVGVRCGWRRPFPLLALVWLGFSPYYLELYMGQFDFVVGAGILLALLAFSSDRPRLGALAWIAATTVKYNGLILVPALIKARRYGTLAAFGLVAVAVCGPWFALHPADLQHVVATARRNALAIPHAGNLGFQAFLSSFLTLGAPSLFRDLDRWLEHGRLLGSGALLEAIFALGLAALALGVTVRARGSDVMAPLAALWLMLYFLVYGEVWEHHYVLMLPAVTLLALSGFGRSAPLVGLLLALPTPFWLLDRPRAEVVAATHARWDVADPFVLWSPSELIGYHAVKALPVAVLFALVARELWRGRERRA